MEYNIAVDAFSIVGFSFSKIFMEAIDKGDSRTTCTKA